MKAFVLTGLKQMEMQDVPTPAIKSPTDVLLKISAVGVCGSDIHYYKEGKIGSQVVKYPFTVGHECSATVARTGSAMKNLAVGSLVAIEPAISCRHCDQCLAGRHHTCRNLRFLGCPGQAEGCLSEYIVMPQECCFSVPEKIKAEQATLSEPLAIGLYAVKKAQAIKGALLAILGCGPIGLSVMLCARLMGAGKIYMTDLIKERLQVAANHGADWVGNPRQQDIVKEITTQSPMLLDTVFKCCGEQSAIDQAVDLLKPGGKLVLVGIPEVDRVSLVIDKARRKEILLVNIRRQCDCFDPMLDLMAGGMLDAGFMITHRFSFEKTKEAFDLVAGYSDGVVKAVIEFAP
jgi:L-iditol 2-dehydrogenase